MSEMILTSRKTEIKSEELQFHTYYINSCEKIGGTKAYELQNLLDEKSVVNEHCCLTATKIAVSIMMQSR